LIFFYIHYIQTYIMSEIFCVKCHKKTKTNNEEIKIAKNNRKMIWGICEVCGTKKNQFIKGESKEKVVKAKKTKNNDKVDKLIEINA